MPTADLPARLPDHPQAEQGLFGKFHVARVDGRDCPGGDREAADYFVLDLAHDVHARPAIAAYVASLEADGGYPDLAADLRARYLNG